tara:strand:- start:119 stop:754 length:636 start_codon:yes stop_codon:yes gene_type:complete
MNNSSSDSFYGLGTHEWIGIILPYKSQKNQQDGTQGFGIRRRVAIMGYHPSDISQIPDDQIVFALVALPTVAGSGAAGRKMSVRLTQGDVVLGKFLDGSAKQNPIILHLLGRTRDTKIKPDERYGVKTGYVGSLKVTNLLPPDKKAGLPPPQYNADAPELTPSAIKDTTKSNRSSSNAQRLMKKSGLVGGAVGVLKSKAKNIGGSVIKSLF